MSMAAPTCNCDSPLRLDGQRCDVHGSPAMRDQLRNAENKGRRAAIIEVVRALRAESDKDDRTLLLDYGPETAADFIEREFTATDEGERP